MKDHGVTRLPDGSLRVPARAHHGQTIGDGRKLVRPFGETAPEYERWIQYLKAQGVAWEDLPEEQP